MAQFSTCLQGHRWETVSDDPAAGDGPCPMCGGPPLVSQVGTLAPPTRASEPATLPLAPVLPAVKLGVSIPSYEILGELGRGGMGVVYKARQIKADRLVALKMILAGAHAGADALARFRTEAQAVAQLQHPNIVQVFEVGDDHGLPYFSLEFCAGGSLEKKLAGTPLPPLDAARLVETLARAMQTAHAKGIIHRDLKPANVLLAEDGTPKITDFGLAKRLETPGQTATGAVMGTPSYMAPEQAGGKGKTVGPAADIYALGAILYECLTGRPPFRAATPLDTVLQVIDEEPVSPRRLNSCIPRDLEAVCLKALSKQPTLRYRSAEELAEDCRRCLRGEAPRARRVTAFSSTWRWLQHSRRVRDVGVLMLTTSCLVGVFAIISFILYLAQPRSPSDPDLDFTPILLSSGIICILAALQFWIGMGTLRRKSWAIWAGLLLSLAESATFQVLFWRNPWIDAGGFLFLVATMFSVQFVAYVVALLAMARS